MLVLVLACRLDVMRVLTNMYVHKQAATPPTRLLWSRRVYMTPKNESTQMLSRHPHTQLKYS